ncbi:DnaB-like helicase N-terminal domain-containing protein [Actinosynnema sp. NPDC059335]|uniref:DnaB-like helicase N-terminal domain-containing protein n=1 Tax=Actinosynnema sp. NPDC059335 TaxID=3346804 RepID=UPI00366D30D6
MTPLPPEPDNEDVVHLPPQDRQAEMFLLGAMLTSPTAVTEAAAILTADGSDFYLPAHQVIYRAILDVHGDGITADPVTVNLAVLDRLDTDALKRIGGGPYLHTLQATPHNVVNARQYATSIADKATLRRVAATTQRLTDIVARGHAGDDLEDLFGEIRTLIDGAEHRRAGVRVEDRYANGASFILDSPRDVPAVWGKGDDVLWAEGEALMICGGNGVGKTTIAIQVLRARLGLDHEVLGLPVQPTESRVLYLAMDRPRQIQRAMQRRFTEEDRDILENYLEFWEGPPLADMALQTTLLLQMCEQAGADTVFIDSLKDAAIGLVKDEIGAGYNRARQTALAAGVQVIELHHMVKRGANGGDPDSIADIYGSAWLTGGAGSVIHLAGQPGDPVVRMRHMKQPLDEVGPWNVLHDHRTGRSSIQHDDIDPLVILRNEGLQGLSAKRLAEVISGGSTVKPADVQKARRKLEKLVEAGLANRVEVTAGAPVVYFARALMDEEDR